MSTPEFDQNLVERVAKAIHIAEYDVPEYDDVYPGGIQHAMMLDVARAALVAAMQPEPCQTCGGSGAYRQGDICHECDGYGFSDAPPALWLATTEQVGWYDDEPEYDDDEYFPHGLSAQRERPTTISGVPYGKPVYAYRPPVRTDNEGPS